MTKLIKIFMLIAFATQVVLAGPAIRINNIKVLPAPLKSVEANGEGNVTFNLFESNGEVVPATVSGDVNTEINIDLVKCKLKNEDTTNIFGALLTYFNVIVANGGKTLTFEQKIDIPGDTFEPIRILVEVTENAVEPIADKVGALVNISATTGSAGDGSSYVFTEPAPTVDAVNDALTVDPGMSTTTVFVNDDADGTTPATNALLTDPTISNNDGLTGLTIDANGILSVPSGTVAGIYTITYGICLEAYPTICDDANVSLTVTAAPIDAVDDTNDSVLGSIGGEAIEDITINDTLDGNAVTLGTDVTIDSVTNTTPLEVDIATGKVIVPAGTPAGIYTETYTLCEVLNATNCEDANVTVTVIAAAIDAVDDTNDSVLGSIGGEAIEDITINDTLDGNAVTLGTDVTIDSVTNTTPLEVDIATGSVTVRPGTPAGTYVETYTLCEVLNPTNCEDANVTVTVINNPDYTPKIRLTGATTSGPDTMVPAILTVTEIEEGINTSDIIIRIPRHDYISFVYNNALTELNGKNVNNADWELLDHPAEYRFKYIGNASIFAVSTFSRVGLEIRVQPESGTSGKIDFQIDIKPGNGDVNAVNDRDSAQIDYVN